MLGQIDYTINDLFAQLGLDSDDTAIDNFIQANQLSDDILLTDAPCFTDTQKTFLKEEKQKNAVWAIVIDELNAHLHGQ